MTNFFSVPGAARHCLSLDSVAQAETFRQRFLNACAAIGADRQTFHDAGLRPPEPAPLDIVIVGAGPTGIELAADLRHTADTLVRYRLSGIAASRQVRIRILERGPSLLPGLDPGVAALAARKLAQLGVEVCTGTAVAEVRAHAVVASDGRQFPATLTVWAAGVRGPDLAIVPPLDCNLNNQILVNDQLRSMGDARIHAMGDCCALQHAGRAKACPPSAQAARQQADFLYKVFAAHHSRAPQRFRYRDYGTLLTLGRCGTIGILLSTLRVRGALASLLYRFSYERYVMSHLGWPRMLGHMAARWCRSKMLMPVRWH